MRLFQGNFDKETVFSDDPLATARSWQEQGGHRLHLVDLDGAVQGRPVHLEMISSIIQALDIPVQVGGGIRDLAAADAWLTAGVDRVVIGTAAVRDPGMVREICRKHGNQRVVVSVDAKDGLVALHGWRETSSVTVLDLAGQMAQIGVARLLYTDITRDGTMTSPNFDAVQEMVNHGSHAGNVRVIASGGIASIEHLRRLAEIGVEGAIVGSAIYRGTLDLEQAIAELAPGTD